MAKDTKTKFGFQIADNFHTILSVHDNKIGELTIAPSFAENYSEIEFGNLNAEKKITDQHYTVHNSPQFEEENVLNHTLKYVDGTKTNTRIYTRAFKRTNLSCPVLLVRGQDFSIQRYRTQKDDKNNYISLGDYNPKTATQYYMVVVSNLGLTFSNDYPDLNVETIHFQKYSVSILYSYGLVPSHSTGNKSHFLTQKEFETQLKEGFSKNEIINVYRQTRQIQHLSFLSFLQKEFADRSGKFNLLKGIGFKRSPQLSINDGDKKAIALNHAYETYVLGKKAQDDGLIDDALKLFDVSAGIFNEQGEVIAYADTLNSKGIIFQITGYPSKAIKCYDEASEIYRTHNLFFQIARAYLNLSFVHRDTADYETAIKMVTEALNISSQQGFTSLQAEANLELGVLYKNAKQLERAYNFLSIALTKYKEDHNAGGEAFCLGNMGLIRAMERKFTEALILHDQALNIFTSLSHKWGIANELANVGNMNCVLGNFDLGHTQLSSALERHRGTGYQYGIATDLKLIGIHFINKGERQRGRQFLGESKDLLIKIGNHHEANQISQILKETET
jgi:tetratricopeptide (TPR) repeat protein